MKFKDVAVGASFTFADSRIKDPRYMALNWVKHPAVYAEWMDKMCVPKGWAWACAGREEDIAFMNDYEVKLIPKERYAEVCLTIYESKMRSETVTGMHPYDIDLARTAWSRQLKNKLSESKDKDRRQVVVDYLDED